ncbi:hypothetical protein V2647_02815 [Tenacibaculum maritimum]|uniref:hypothetical protein n=2 Tax=Tenacibaculum maritimum TaxID=107401 RepID=UPI0012E5DF78|nr:hypothetical protein [Tenacibaculum maritimum]CAA0245096.1 conserved hypothetical protein [Tenacibaculum maritimum]CAA0251785.1 conserved hypothetical protein [Tenacibaculum maritimum]
MKNRLIKFLLGVVILSLIYYVATLTLTNHGQFINYYHYPSSSISESKEHSNFLSVIPQKKIIIEGDEEFKKYIENDLDLWYDEFKVKKSFGLLNLFPYNSIDKDKVFLRIGYKDSEKNYTLSYKESTWLEIQNNEINSISASFGFPFKIGDTATLKFYKDKKKETLFGTLKILVD